jgi:hypothetical protein
MPRNGSSQRLREVGASRYPDPHRNGSVTGFLSDVTACTAATAKPAPHITNKMISII